MNLSDLARRQLWIEDSAGAFRAHHGQALGIDEPDLHQNAGLIPIDVLMRNLAVLAADNHDKAGPSDVAA